MAIFWMTLWLWTMIGICMALLLNYKMDVTSLLWVCGSWSFIGVLTSVVLVGVDRFFRKKYSLTHWTMHIMLTFFGVIVFIMLIPIVTSVWPSNIPPASSKLQQYYDILAFSSLSVAVWTLAYSLIGSIQAQRLAMHVAMQARAESTQMKLSLLHQQLHPHFLFNSLNTLSSLLDEDSVKAQALLIHLSDLLDQALTQNNSDLVPLSKELGFLRPYLQIEQARWEDALHIEFNEPTPFIDVPLPWMSTQILVENAIKHALPTSGGRREVKIDIWYDDSMITVRIINSGKLGNTTATTSPGVGLSNLQSRLNSLYTNESRLSLEQKGENVWALMQVPIKMK